MLRCAPFARSLFISVNPTPNPDVQKFIPTPTTAILPEEFGHTMVLVEALHEVVGIQQREGGKSIASRGEAL